MLQLTAAAAVKRLALRAHAVLGRRVDLDRLSVTDGALAFEDFDTRFFARQKIRHKDSRSVRLHDRFPVRPERLRNAVKKLILLH